MSDWKTNVSFILVEAREPGNIGAAARAMKNMGFRGLELVNPRDVLTDQSRSMACGAVDLLEKARVWASLGEAIGDKALTIGTTRRTGRRRGLIVPLKEGVKRAAAAAVKNKVAILFGREDKGLKNAEVGECDFLMTIPADPSFPSLNLAQSVLLTAYELGQAVYETKTPKLVGRAEIDRLWDHLQSALKLLEYSPRGDRDIEGKVTGNLRHLIGRAGLTEWELRTLHGISRQIERKLKRKLESKQ